MDKKSTLKLSKKTQRKPRTPINHPYSVLTSQSTTSQSTTSQSTTSQSTTSQSTTSQSTTKVNFDEYIQYYEKQVSEDLAVRLVNSTNMKFPIERSICTLYTKKFTVPRDQIFVSNSIFSSYKYSGHKIKTILPYPEFQELMDFVSKFVREKYQIEVDFSGTIINRYVNGKDGVSWHFDKKESMSNYAENKGKQLMIISISFGIERQFQIRLKSDHCQKITYSLGHCDILVMKAGSQELFEHQVPKKNNLNGQRLNFTFRVFV